MPLFDIASIQEGQPNQYGSFIDIYNFIIGAIKNEIRTLKS